MRDVLVDFDKIIVDVNSIWAHIRDGVDDKNDVEGILTHSEIVYSRLFVGSRNNRELKSIENIMERIIIRLGVSNIFVIKKFLMMAMANSFYMHDIGKVSPGYQYGILGNMYFESICRSLSTEHSPYSVIIYINEMLIRLKDILDTYELTKMDCLVAEYFLIAFSQIIYKHHSYIVSISEYIEILKKFLIEKNGDGFKVRGLNAYRELVGYMGEDHLKYIALILAEENTAILKAKTEFIKAEFAVLINLMHGFLVRVDRGAAAEFN